MDNSVTQWMCVRLTAEGKVDIVGYATMKHTRRESIKEMTKTRSGRPPAYNWRQLRGYGWRCVKAIINFQVDEGKK